MKSLLAQQNVSLLRSNEPGFAAKRQTVLHKYLARKQIGQSFNLCAVGGQLIGFLDSQLLVHSHLITHGAAEASR